MKKPVRAFGICYLNRWIYTLFPGGAPVKRVGGDVAEWSKALPC